MVLSVNQRAELLAIALWPRPVAVPEAPSGVDRDAALSVRCELRAEGWSFSRIAGEVGVPCATLKDRARRGLV